MSVETVENTDIDLTILFDFEEELPCEFNPCDDVAEWKIFTSCCGKMLLFCDDHFQEHLNHEGVFYHSVGCGAQGFRTPFAFYERIKA